MPNTAHGLKLKSKILIMNITENNDDDSNITPAEKAMLDEAMHYDPLSKDEINLNHARLDNVDEDGDTLNVIAIAEDNSGDDLDVPGAEDDDENESIGEEDEENNGYSQADTE